MEPKGLDDAPNRTMMQSIEAVRASYRPKRVTTLFVGESAPNSGTFFYLGNTALAQQMDHAMEAACLTGTGDFRERFKAYGWYLDDLVLTPVNQMPSAERKKTCREAQKSLAGRIAEYQPQAIVSLLLSIKEIVEAAADEAGSSAPRFAVPFPGNGQQGRFQKAMAQIIQHLPRESG